MITVFKREFRSFFMSFRGYAFAGIFAVATILIRMLYYYTALYEKLYGYMNIEYTLTYLPIAFVLAAPVLVFGAFADISNKGTRDFLKALPISNSDILFGKLLSAFSVFLATYGLVELVSWVLGFYGSGNAGTRFVFILGYILSSMAMLSIFCFVSLMIKNRLVALGVNYGIAIPCSLYCIFRGDMPKVLENILEPFSVIGAFNSAIYGIVDLASIILWVSVTAFFTMLTYFFFNKEFND